MTAAKAPFAKMKNGRPLRIMVLGQGGVGKSGERKHEVLCLGKFHNFRQLVKFDAVKMIKFCI
jgi:hypothetical protein